MTRFGILAAFAICGSLALADEPDAAALLELHTADARAYRIFRDEKQTEPLELRPKSIFTWQNLVGEATQSGHLFVWTHAGRPEAIGTVFSNRSYMPGKRQLTHEFHTLAERQLFPVTPDNSMYQWTPEKGMAFSEVKDAPAVAATASKRLPQMRAIARSFAASSESRDGQKWELRLLPTPLLQYQPTSGDVLEGAIFAMVSSAGTDPEVLLVIEARRPSGGESRSWHAAAVRFSDKDLIVKRNGELVWSSLEDESRRVSISSDYTLLKTPDKTYMCYRSRTIDELPAKAP